MEDYTEAGFDKFLSRGNAPNLSGGLDNNTTISTAQNYDRGQQAGSIGDVIRVGNFLIDGSANTITLYDQNTPILKIGDVGNNFLGLSTIQSEKTVLFAGLDNNNKSIVKVAKDTFDATQATNDELIFNSDQDIFKIVLSDVYTFPSVSVAGDGTAAEQTAVIPHLLGSVPVYMLYVATGNFSGAAFSVFPSKGYIPLPFNQSVFDGVANITSTYQYTVDANNLYLYRSQVQTTGSPKTSATASIKYYILQETAI